MVPLECLADIGLRYEWIKEPRKKDEKVLGYSDAVLIENGERHGKLVWRGDWKAFVNGETYKLPEDPYNLPPFEYEKKLTDYRWMIPADFIRELGVDFTWNIKEEK